METMRRLITSIAALSLVAIVVGCDHTAGICDCDQGGHAAVLHPQAVSSQMKPESKELAKASPMPAAEEMGPAVEEGK